LKAGEKLEGLSFHLGYLPSFGYKGLIGEIENRLGALDCGGPIGQEIT